MINLENLTATEAEALAYSEGFPGTARQFARIADLQRALKQAVATLEEIAYHVTEKHRPGAAVEALATIDDIVNLWEIER
jgi:hypothetical protein